MKTVFRMTYNIQMDSGISVVAAICSTIASLPQLWRSCKYHAVQDLHPFTLTIRMLGCASWCAYGLMKEEFALAISSAIAFLLECLLLYMKYKEFCCRDMSVSVEPSVKQSSDSRITGLSYCPKISQ